MGEFYVLYFLLTVDDYYIRDDSFCFDVRCLTSVLVRFYVEFSLLILCIRVGLFLSKKQKGRGLGEHKSCSLFCPLSPTYDVTEILTVNYSYDKTDRTLKEGRFTNLYSKTNGDGCKTDEVPSQETGKLKQLWSVRVPWKVFTFLNRDTHE